jgi:hypothetical protein
LFDSIVAQVAVPFDVNYSATDLRRQLVMWMATHPGVIMESQEEQIRALYGSGDLEGVHGRRSSGAEGIGPFSLQSYLTYMLDETSWGDQVSLHALAMMWECRVSLINAQGLYALNFRHSRPVQDADFVIVYNGESHFMGTGNYFR